MTSTNDLLHPLYVKADRLMISVIWVLFAISCLLAERYYTWSAVFAIGLPTALAATALDTSHRAQFVFGEFGIVVFHSRCPLARSRSILSLPCAYCVSVMPAAFAISDGGESRYQESSAWTAADHLGREGP